MTHSIERLVLEVLEAFMDDNTCADAQSVYDISREIHEKLDIDFSIRQPLSELVHTAVDQAITHLYQQGLIVRETKVESETDELFSAYRLASHQELRVFRLEQALRQIRTKAQELENHSDVNVSWTARSIAGIADRVLGDEDHLPF